MQNQEAVYVLRITGKPSSPHSINAGADGVPCVFIKTTIHTNTQARRVILHNIHLQNKTTVQHFANLNLLLCNKQSQLSRLVILICQSQTLHLTSPIAALLHLKSGYANIERFLSRVQYQILLHFQFRFIKLPQSFNESSTVNNLKLNLLIDLKRQQQLGTPNIAFTEIQQFTMQLWRRPISAAYYIQPMFVQLSSVEFFVPEQ
ncbi:Hypothetical_protein [Hexamita inflata]|uniref:Hypothetical_protein n=1 Tax=Hexamita inflata TaxID=28002 RepID=A0AA86Q020_9EUKA|nr:Hypothetical protein HINF_LOCUS31612 [Hexamita inflata]